MLRQNDMVDVYMNPMELSSLWANDVMERIHELEVEKVANARTIYIDTETVVKQSATRRRSYSWQKRKSSNAKR